MKILLTTDTWTPTINGVVTSTVSLRTALTAQGHEVRVLTLSGDSHTYTKDGVTFLGSLDAGLVYPGARLRAPALNHAIRDLIAWCPDVVHSQCEFSTFAPARRIAHTVGAPLIHTYHTVYEDYTHYFSPSRSMGRKMAALFTRMICASCDAVIAPTPKISRLLAGYGVHCPVRIIPTGLDLQRFAVPRDDVLRKQLGLPPQGENKTVLLSLGRLAKEKNIAELIKAMQQLPDAVLLIVGDGPERAALEQQAQVLHVADRVIFAGAVPPTEVPRCYALGAGSYIYRGHGRGSAAALPRRPLPGRTGAGRGDRLGLSYACRADRPRRRPAARCAACRHAPKCPPRRAALYERAVRP